MAKVQDIPPSKPYVHIITSMPGEKVERMKPLVAIRLPAMVTARQPYLFERMLAKGPTIIIKTIADSIFTQMNQIFILYSL